MDKHYNTMKDKIGVNKILEEEDKQDEKDCITQDTFKALRPCSPYKLNEVINKDKFSPKKFIEKIRVEERMMGGQTFFRTITADDPEKLRKSIMKDSEYVTSPKLFLTKSDFSDLKQN